jgi:hypothetical protein
MQSQEIDWRYLLHATRARIYLMWAVLTAGGFTATHFYQNHNINYLWSAIAIVGLTYMYKTMPIRVAQMRQIFLAWLVPIVLGMTVSGAVFYIDTPWAANLTGYLGAFWLLVMAFGYFLNGLIDPPSGWYWFNAGFNFLAGMACFYIPDLVPVQYIIAAIASGWSMLNLWIFRS